MPPSIQKLRDLAGTNSALLHSAHATHQKTLAAAEAECTRLSALIAGVSHADVITNEDKAQEYQAWVKQRAGLMRLLGEDHGEK